MCFNYIAGQERVKLVHFSLYFLGKIEECIGPQAANIIR